MNEGLSASYPGLKLTRRQFVPLNGGMIRCFLTFETPYGFARRVSYIIRNSAFLSNVETNMLPGCEANAAVGARDSARAEVDGEDSKIKDDVVTLRIFRPMRQISVSVLAYGSPTSDGGDYIGTVNDDDWPVLVEGMTSKPTGYWLMNKFETMTSKYQGYFTVEAAALTRTNEDWSEYGILRSRRDWKYAMVTDTHHPPRLGLRRRGRGGEAVQVRNNVPQAGQGHPARRAVRDEQLRDLCSGSARSRMGRRPPEWGWADDKDLRILRQANGTDRG
jgi:hypothetical protein